VTARDSAALPAPQRLAGQPAAPGLVLGRIVEIAATPAHPGHRPAGPPREPLTAALAEAVRQLESLRSGTDDAEARKILEFQIEFLTDPALLEPAERQIAESTDANRAWCTSIDAQIADFEQANDDYFRHRVGDLRDMRARVLAILGGEQLAPLQLPPDAILLADDLAPSRFLASDWQPQQAIVLRQGSATAHVALLARARRVPMVVGIGDAPIVSGSMAILDGAAGTLELSPDAAQLEAYALRRARADAERERDADAAARPAATRNGERVQVLLNVSTLDELDTIDPAICDGIGLVRTELLFANGPPDEPTQVAFYRRLFDWAGHRPVVIRTLDAGGDKPIPGVTIDGESHPFLGVRGVRLSLAAPQVFKVQLRALLTAAVAGNLRIMLPMITAPCEVTQVRALLAQAAAELALERRPYAMPPLGIMVEVPAAALALDAFEIDFASIGSNDLLQYTMAVARDNRAVSELADPAHPGFDALLRTIVRSAAARGLSLSLCGDLAAQPRHVPRLLATGLRALSMPAASVGAVKGAIAAWSASAAN
jgi:phosphotransferase system enzyme I (PtsI)